MLELIEPQSTDQIALARSLFVEYADSLGFDLCFQDFEAELKRLPGDYARPDGRMYVALFDGRPVGCIALRRFDTDSCEMKRMYVRPDFRRCGIGRTLAETVIRDARAIGYRRMLLDTAPHMNEAISLYRRLGFCETQPYRFNPLEGALFFALDL